MTDGGRIGQTIQERPVEAEILLQMAPKTRRSESVPDWMARFDAKVESLSLEGVDVGVRKARIRAIRTFAGSAAFGDLDVAVRAQGPDAVVLAEVGERVEQARSSHRSAQFGKPDRGILNDSRAIHE